MEEPGRLQSMGSLRVGHDWWTSLSLFTFIHWRRKWQPTPVFLLGESQGWGSLVGCRPWDRRVRHEWSDLAAAVIIDTVNFYKLLKVQHKLKWRSIYKVKIHIFKKKSEWEATTEVLVSDRTKKQNQRWGLIYKEIGIMKSVKKGKGIKGKACKTTSGP